MNHNKHRKLAKASNIRVINIVWNSPSYAPQDIPIFLPSDRSKDKRVYLLGILSTRLVFKSKLGLELSPFTRSLVSSSRTFVTSPPGGIHLRMLYQTLSNACSSDDSSRIIISEAGRSSRSANDAIREDQASMADVEYLVISSLSCSEEKGSIPFFGLCTGTKHLTCFVSLLSSNRRRG